MPIPKFGTVYLVEDKDMKLRTVGNIHITLEDHKSYAGQPRTYSTVVTDMKYEKDEKFLHMFDFMGKMIEYCGYGWSNVYDIDGVSCRCSYIVTWNHAKGFLFTQYDNETDEVSYVTFLVDLFEPEWGFINTGHSIELPRWCKDMSIKIDYEEIKDCYMRSFEYQVCMHDEGESSYLDGEVVEFMRHGMDNFDERFNLNLTYH